MTVNGEKYTGLSSGMMLCYMDDFISDGFTVGVRYDKAYDTYTVTAIAKKEEVGEGVKEVVDDTLEGCIGLTGIKEKINHDKERNK